LQERKTALQERKTALQERKTAMGLIVLISGLALSVATERRLKLV